MVGGSEHKVSLDKRGFRPYCVGVDWGLNFLSIKSADRSMVIGDVALLEKTGGLSGAYRRAPRNDEGGSET